MIKNIKIKNFKSIEDLSIECSESFNLVIGENNIGKTTIFEAIHLWKICFDSCIKKDKKGFYSIPPNIPFINMESIRIYNDRELFNYIKKGKKTIEIVLVLLWENKEYSLGFKLNVPSTRNSYLQLNYIETSEFKKFETMVKETVGKNLTSFININEAKTVTNIIVREPYMYKGQIKDKISKGKSYEVLRNKIITNMKEVENRISNVLGKAFTFKEIDKENKNYIELHVNGNNLLSYGSGFLQLAEIFSSIEFIDAKINILLFDEPEAHLHFKVQKKLIDHLRDIQNTQIFVITHNERILDVTPENEILFISTEDKIRRIIKPLPKDGKILIKEDLTGILSDLEKIYTSEKVIIVEGNTDKEFIEKLLYLENLNLPVISINGVDNLIDKISALSGIINNKKIFILRDTDLMPLSKIENYKKSINKRLPIATELKKIHFQEGYGIESSIICNIDEFYNFLSNKYFKIQVEDNEVQNIIKEKIKNLNNDIITQCKNIENDIYIDAKTSFDNQKSRRTNEDYYKKLNVEDVLKEITLDKIHYIMNKQILNKYLLKITDIIKYYDNNAGIIESDNLINKYLEYIQDNKSHIFKSHKNIIDEIINF